MDVLIISRPLVVLFRYMIPPEAGEADEVDYKVSTFHVPACPRGLVEFYRSALRDLHRRDLEGRRCEADIEESVHEKQRICLLVQFHR